MTSRKLKMLGRRFLKRLEADEWLRGTHFRVVRKLKTPEGTPLYGLSEWFTEERSALISVNSELNEDDTGTTLVHELLHLVLEGHKPVQTKYDANYELALNRLARALWTEWKS